MGADLPYRAAQRRSNLHGEAALEPPRQTWVTGKVTSVGPDRVSTVDGQLGYPATNMTNGPLHVGQPVVLLLLDGGLRLILGARYLPGVVDHDHDGTYAPVHNHPYAPSSHTHSQYSLTSHGHAQLHSH